jgi:hypothetical protein
MIIDENDMAFAGHQPFSHFSRQFQPVEIDDKYFDFIIHVFDSIRLTMRKTPRLDIRKSADVYVTDARTLFPARR